MVLTPIRAAVLVVLAFVVPAAGPVLSQEKSLTLSAPAALSESGLLRYVLPRFSLKTNVRVLLSEDAGAADVVIAADPDLPEGRALIADARDGTTYFVAPSGTGGSAHAARFLEWLGSETGERTLLAYRLNDEQIFELPVVVEAAPEPEVFTGDLALGEDLSLVHCGRCHVINARNKSNGIGSAPSFAALKAMADWDFRFQVFYTLAPHPAFTQLEGITAPFDPARPSPIAPVVMDEEGFEAIMAYVRTITPMDLGAQIQLK